MVIKKQENLLKLKLNEFKKPKNLPPQIFDYTQLQISTI